MTGRVKFPSYLYVRVDRPLRASLVAAAKARGITVSDYARRELRKALADPYQLNTAVTRAGGAPAHHPHPGE